jgi:hypothetical protein
MQTETLREKPQREEVRCGSPRQEATGRVSCSDRIDSTSQTEKSYHILEGGNSTLSATPLDTE